MKLKLTAAAFAVGLAFSTPGWGDSSSVNIQQFGDDNQALVEQTSSTGSFASVFQSGNNNGPFEGFQSISQVNSTNSFAGVAQFGNSNTNTVLQFGQAGSSAHVGQQGNGNTGFSQQFGGSNNVGWVFQGGFACLDRSCSDFVFNANSNDNFAGVSQFSGGAGNTAIIIQSGGPFNSASTTQFAGEGNSAFVTQEGTRNFANISQSGGENNSGRITQSGGPFNNSNIAQNGGANNVATNTQTGSDNSSSIQQGGLWCAGETCDDFGASTGSTASVNQSGMFQQSRVGQFGTANATVNQGGTYNESTILQVGLSNNVSSSQTGTGGSFAERNIASFDQRGNNLSAGLSQNGMLNVATFDQRGNSMSASVGQFGNGNVSNVVQR